jgi:prepilin-type N-terminal cleavage/methylation domain-containing protein
MNKGFTMVELLAAILILALIVIISLPAYNNISNDIRSRNLENKTRAIALAMHKYASNYELDRIKPFGHNPCNASMPCCQVYDLYTFIVANGIYAAEEDAVNPGESTIADPITNQRLEGCVQIHYNLSLTRIESKFIQGNCSSACDIY